jgi:nucleoside-diphosphate-sugar epimerase
MSTLIIGGGLVGSQIARALVEEGERPTIMDASLQSDALADLVDPDAVTIVQGNVLNPLDISRALKSSGASRIAHMAAYPMLTEGAQRDPYAAIQVNVFGALNVLEAARLEGVSRVVLASSGVLTRYIGGGEDEGDPAKEEAYPRPTTFYAATKQAVESIGLNYGKWTDLEVAVVRFAAVAGPWRGRGGGGPTGNFKNMIERSLHGEEFAIPDRSVEWLYSKDAARGTVLALNIAELKSSVFNLSMGRAYSPAEIVETVHRIIPTSKLSVKAGTAVTESVGGMVALDLSRSRRDLGFEPRFDLPAAIDDYIQWYQGVQS